MRSNGTHRQGVRAPGGHGAGASEGGQGRARSQRRDGEVRAVASQALAEGAGAASAAAAAIPSSESRLGDPGGSVVDTRDLTQVELRRLRLMYQALIKAGLSSEEARYQVASSLREMAGIGSAHPEWNAMRAEMKSPEEALGLGASFESEAQIMETVVGDDGAFVQGMRGQLILTVLKILQSEAPDEELQSRIRDELRALQNKALGGWNKYLMDAATAPGAAAWRDESCWDRVRSTTRQPLSKAVCSFVRVLLKLEGTIREALANLQDACHAYVGQMILKRPRDRAMTLQAWSARVEALPDRPDPELLKELVLHLVVQGPAWTKQVEDEVQRDRIRRSLETLVEPLRACPQGEAARLFVLWLQFEVIGGGRELSADVEDPDRMRSLLQLLPPAIPLLQVMESTHEVAGNDLGFLLLLGIAMGTLEPDECTGRGLLSIASMPISWSRGSIGTFPALMLTPAQGAWLAEAIRCGGSLEVAQKRFLDSMLVLARRGVAKVTYLFESPTREEERRFLVMARIVEQLELNPNTSIPMLEDFPRWFLRGCWLRQKEDTPLPRSLQPSESEALQYLSKLSWREEITSGQWNLERVQQDAMLTLLSMDMIPPDKRPEGSLSLVCASWEGLLLSWLRWAPKERLGSMLVKLDRKPHLAKRLCVYLLNPRVQDRMPESIRYIERLMRAGVNRPRAALHWLICDERGLVEPLTEALRERVETYLKQVSNAKAAGYLELSSKVVDLLMEGLEDSDLDARLQTVALLSEKRFQEVSRLSFDREAWERLSPSETKKFLADPRLASKSTLDLWLAWALSDDPSCRRVALGLANSMAGTSGALLRAWCERHGKTDVEILEFLDSQAQEQDLLSTKGVGREQWTRRHEELCAPCAGGRSRWIHWCVADAEGRLRKQLSESLEELSEVLPLSEQDFRWLLDQVTETGAGVDGAPRVLKLVARNAENYSDVWAQWWETLPKEALAGAVSLLKLAPPGDAGRANLLQLVWNETLPAMIGQRIVDDLMQLADEKLLNAVEHVPLDPARLMLPAAELCQRRLLMRLAQAWSTHPDPARWHGVRRLLDAAGTYNPFVAGRVASQEIGHRRLCDLMEQPINQGLSRWVVWWLQGTGAMSSGCMELGSLPSVGGRLPWRLSPVDAEWMIDRLTEHPDVFLDPLLARALLEATSDRPEDMVRWLESLQQAHGAAPTMILAVSLWQAGLPMEDQDRNALLAYVGGGKSLPLEMSSRVGALVLSWSNDELLRIVPALRDALRDACKDGQWCWLTKEQKRELRVRYGSILKEASGGENPIAGCRSPSSNRPSPASQTSTPRVLRASPTREETAAAATASADAAPPPLLLHPRFLRQFHQLPTDQQREAVRDWLNNLAITGRPDRERPSSLIGRWRHAHIAAVHPPLVVAYRMGKDNVKVDWIMAHDNDYDDDRGIGVWQRWKDEDIKAKPIYSREQL